MPEPLSVSELIKKLQDVLKNHGDLKVYHVAEGDIDYLYDIHVDRIKVMRFHDSEKRTIVLLE
jgi:hypothetical protein